jgi:membrane-associated PAP2 superfamily phosphatase
MNRAGLLIALAVAVVCGAVFALYPQWDVAISRLFFDNVRGEFPRLVPIIDVLREASMWIVALLAAPAFVAVAVKLVAPRRPMLIPARAALFLISTLVLAPGLAVNLGLKDYWGRPRPMTSTEFGGRDKFLPWWDFRGSCRDNCSFVAGEPSGAFWALAPAALAPAAWRPAAYGAAVLFGLGVGALRIVYGGHYFSDVIFAGVVTFFIVWMAYALIYRWSRNRLTDAVLERALAGAVAPLHAGARWLWRRCGAPEQK